MANTDYSGLFGWGQVIPAANNHATAKKNIFGTYSPEGFDPQYLTEAANYAIFGNGTFRFPSVEEYQKVFQTFKDNPAEYYKAAIAATAKTIGHNQSLVDYSGGPGRNDSLDNGIETASAALKKFGQEAVDKGYLKVDQIRDIAESPYSSAYSKQSGYNNPDLRSGSGLFGKTLGAITSNPITTLLAPIAIASGIGALPSVSAGISSSLAPTLGSTGANIASGSLIGAGTSAAMGGDPIKGAVLGGIASGSGIAGSEIGKAVESPLVGNLAGTTIGTVGSGIVTGNGIDLEKLGTNLLANTAGSTVKDVTDSKTLGNLANLGIKSLASGKDITSEALISVLANPTTFKEAGKALSDYQQDSYNAARELGLSEEEASEVASGVKNALADSSFTQVFDDGSTLTSDAYGNPISGTDFDQNIFNVIDGIGQYEDGSKLGGTPEMNFGGELADPEDVRKLLEYNASLTSQPSTSKDTSGGVKSIVSAPSSGATGSGSSGGNAGSNAASTGGSWLDALLAMGLGGALGYFGAPKDTVPVVGYQGGVPEFTATRVPGQGVTYTPKNAAEGGLMNLYDKNTPVVMMASGGGVSDIPQTHEAHQAPQVSQNIVSPVSQAPQAGIANTPDLMQILAAAQKASSGMSTGSANGIAYLVSRGYDPTEAISLINSNADMAKFAKGGISDLGSYTHAKGGRMLKGPGDGMSDSIPADIDGKRPARLATDEFVVPADVVSHLGNGSSDAGAKVLYDMMAKIRKARTGNAKQGKKINPSKFVPA